MISKDDGKTSKEIFEEIYCHLKESKLLDKLEAIKITTHTIVS